MPDTLKQFYNASINVTGLTGNQTATLFTNNATTRAVIKDIDVANTFPVVPNLTVGGTTTAALSGNLTGSEIVDVSQAVGFSFPAPLSFTSSLLVYLNNSSPVTQRATTGYNINGTQVNSINADQAIPNLLEVGASFATVIYYAPDGDVFSVQTNGLQTNYLLKNAGGAGGTRTTINTGNTTNNAPIAFDGVNTFYWLSSSTNLRIFNADTETTTNIAIQDLSGFGAPTNQTRLLHSNGYLFYATNQNLFPFIIEISTGRWLRCNGNTTYLTWWDQDASVPGFWFEPSTRVATVFYFRAAAPNLYYRAISPALPAFTGASDNFSTPWEIAANTASGFANRQAATTNTHIVLSSADGGVMFDASNFPCILNGLSTSGVSVALTLIPSSVSSTIWRPRRHAYSSATVNTTNFPNTISLRVTGVEVTP
ncbi:hypothetical protein UFOVP506_28 [uncultured Caudovirales phage]|uniref:Uncharacterized protein n=1 Tax=uncultured Caudovirales phage TaxID=2100421 RepID=A0A6J5MM96_9CAUD|nr:hypothetical protein UFOVP506_28 [uncultured Caudovirales phage]